MFQVPQRRMATNMKISAENFNYSLEGIPCRHTIQIVLEEYGIIVRKSLPPSLAHTIQFSAQLTSQVGVLPRLPPCIYEIYTGNSLLRPFETV